MEAPLQLPLGEKGMYGQDCVFIANDWHAALVPVYLAAKYRAHGVYMSARSIMAIHNLRHQVRANGRQTQLYSNNTIER
jgi:starch synthase